MTLPRLSWRQARRHQADGTGGDLGTSVAARVERQAEALRDTWGSMAGSATSNMEEGLGSESLDRMALEVSSEAQYHE